MRFGSLDGRESGEYNGIEFEEISRISATQDTFFFGRGPLYRV